MSEMQLAAFKFRDKESVFVPPEVSGTPIEYIDPKRYRLQFVVALTEPPPNCTVQLEVSALHIWFNRAGTNIQNTPMAKHVFVALQTVTHSAHLLVASGVLDLAPLASVALAKTDAHLLGRDVPSGASLYATHIDVTVTTSPGSVGLLWKGSLK